MKKLAVFCALFISLPLLAFASPESQRDAFINAAKAYIGTPYVYGGTSKSGIDCSGLIYMAARNAGLQELPRTAALMYQATTRITDAQRQKGDLVFFKAGSTVSHVGIYLGPDKFLHAPSDGAVTGVQIGQLSRPYWERTYYGAGRFLPAMTGKAATAASSGNSVSTNYTGSKSSGNTSTKKTSSSSSGGKKKTSALASRTAKPVKHRVPRSGNTHFAADIQGAFDWTFLGQDGTMGFIPQGGLLRAEIRTDLWKFDPGLFAGITYNVLPDTDFLKCLEFPMGLSITFLDYIDLYGGVVLTTSTDPIKQQYAKKEVNTVLFPGIFGVKFMTPPINMNFAYLVFNQDISYTIRTAAKGYDKLEFMEALGSGLSFSTGVTLRFKF